MKDVIISITAVVITLGALTACSPKQQGPVDLQRIAVPHFTQSGGRNHGIWTLPKGEKFVHRNWVKDELITTTGNGTYKLYRTIGNEAELYEIVNEQVGN